MKTYVVETSYSVAGRGTALFFVDAPRPELPLRRSQIRMMVGDSQSIESVTIEAARVGGSEVLAVLVPNKVPEELPPGTRITILE